MKIQPQWVVTPGKEQTPINSVTVITGNALNFTHFFVTRLSITRLDFETALPKSSVRIVRPITAVHYPSITAGTRLA